jgi:biotin operon repressor
MLRDTPLGRQVRLIILLERKHHTAEQIEDLIGCCRRTVFRYLVRLEELGVKVGMRESKYHVVSIESDLRELTRQLKRALPGR